MIFFYRRVHGTQFRTRLVEIFSGREPRKKLRHAMGTLSHHRCAEMMRTAGDIRDNLGFLRVWDARLEHTDDCASAIASDAAKLNGPANNRRIFPERVRPETIRSEERRVGKEGKSRGWE